MVHVVVWRDLAERYRPALMGSKLLQVKGKLENQSGVASPKQEICCSRMFGKRLRELVWDANKVSSVQIKYHPYK